MSTLIPSASACHAVQLPPIEKDDRLNLNVRTGSASTLYNSFVCAYGGITIGLDLGANILIAEITALFAKKVVTNKLKRLKTYISGEIFFLDLINRVWSRVLVPPGAPKPSPRLFHELATGNKCLYMFGGLVLADEDDELSLLVPSNDLWRFDLITQNWSLLHDGSGWESDPTIPAPRFSHKMTSISKLSFANKDDHFGLMIAGGHDCRSKPIYTNCVFDLVEGRYVDAGPPLSAPSISVDGKNVDYYCTSSAEKHINVNYLNSVILNFVEEVEYPRTGPPRADTAEESILFYVPTQNMATEEVINPILSSRVTKKINRPKVLPLSKKRNMKSKEVTYTFLRRTVPFNLQYPTGGVFGQNLVIIGFLPNDYDISIFIYNKPTGKWSRLNIFCHHDYGSHRFWGGFVWTSHHKVVLLGNYVTSRTTSSVRYFSSLITVSLPVTNILASMEIAGDVTTFPKIKYQPTSDHHYFSDTDTSTSEEELVYASSLLHLSDSDESNDHNPIRRFSNISARSEAQRFNNLNTATFDDYVRYAAPKVKFTKVRSVFPPAAITLGRNAFDRYGNVIADFEIVSANGDRIPVCMSILVHRWGKYFINLLSKAYVLAVSQFEQNEIENTSSRIMRSSKSSESSTSSLSGKFRFSSNESLLSGHSNHGSRENLDSPLNVPKPSQKSAPLFRLPFQDKVEGSSSVTLKDTQTIDPHKQIAERRDSSTSLLSGGSAAISQFKQIPHQLPMPNEPIPDVPSTPTTYRSSSRKNSYESPRASILHTLSVLRKIPVHKSPRGSPFHSPRGSLSGPSAMPATITDDAFTETVDPPVAERHDGDITLSDNSHDSDAEAMKRTVSSSDSPDEHADANEFSRVTQSLLDFQNTNADTFSLELSLVPRKLYIPFGTSSIKAFAEYLYTGQVGNTWTLKPCALDCLVIARYFQVPLLYDLLCEVLYGIIGRKEALVIKEGKRYKRKFNDLFEKMHSPIKSTFKFPLDDYEGFLDTVDDGYMDIALLRKSSNVHKNSTSSRGSKRKSSLSMHNIQEDPIAKMPPSSGNISSDVTDETTSASDEEAPTLHFLDNPKSEVLQGPNYKSVLDKSIYDSVGSAKAFDNDNAATEDNEMLNSLTLEMLVSPDSAEPSNTVIDLIHEMASVCTDVKLMLRSMNARLMGFALEQTKRDYYALEKAYLDGLARQSEEEDVDDLDITKPVRHVESTSNRLSAITRESSAHSVPTLKSLSLRPTDSDPKAGLESKPRVPATGLFKLTPLSEQKVGSKDANKKLDKEIAQRIRQEERSKQKARKEEKLKHEEKLKSEKRESELRKPPSQVALASSQSRDSFNDAGSIFSHKPIERAHTSVPMTESPSSHGKSKHKFLGRISSKMRGSEKDQSGPSLSRTESATSVLLGSSKKSGSSKTSGASKLGFFGSRKR